MLFNSDVYFKDANTVVVEFDLIKLPKLSSTENQWVLGSTGHKHQLHLLDPIPSRSDIWINAVLYQNLTDEERALIHIQDYRRLRRIHPFSLHPKHELESPSSSKSLTWPNDSE